MRTIRLGLPGVAMPYMPMYIADEQGLFAQQGLKVEIVTMHPSIIPVALMHGELDFGGTVTTSIDSALQGGAVRVSLGLFDGSPWIMMAGPGVRAGSDLRGKTIAIGGMYAPPYFFALEGLKKLGLDPATDVNYIDTGGTSGALTALASGQVGAAVVTPPYDIKAKELGFGELLFLGDLLDYPYGGVATSLAHIDGQPSLVKDTTRALLHSVQWWRQHPAETQEMIVAKLGIGSAEAAATYETFTRILTVTGDTKESSIRNYVKSQQPDRDVETDLALETIVNTRLLREVQAELGLK